MREVHSVRFRCTFCGHTWTEEMAIPKTEWALQWCKVCGVTAPKRGQQVRYGAPERALAGAIFADRHLTRGAVYTIRRMKRWQHGCHIALQETGENLYELLLFTPVAFQHASTPPDANGAAERRQKEHADDHHA